MTHIDTKELRELDTDSNLGLSIPMSHEAIGAIADELDRLYALEADTAPLSREELEDELRKAGYPVIACDNDEDGGKPYCWDNRMHVILSHMDDLIVRDLTKNKLVLSVPLSAVTRRLLKDCGVIK